MRDGTAGSPTWRDSRVDTSVDGFGRTVTVNSTGFLDASGDETCAKTWYITGSAAPSTMSPGWMNLVAQTASYATLGTQPTHPMNGTSPVPGACGSQPTAVAKTFYNNNAYASGSVANGATGQPLGAGFKPIATTSMTRIKNWNGATDDLNRWVWTGQTFDTAGRITSMIDANGNTTGFTFNTTYGYPNQATYPVGSMTTGAVLRPADGLPDQTTDQNNLTIYYCYDNLSRLTAVYAPLVNGTRSSDPCSTYPGFTGDTGEVPTVKFGYYVGWYSDTSRTAKVPAIVWTSTLQATVTDASDDVRLEAAAYIDGNGRTRETQTHSPTQNKIIVTAGLTDDRGNPITSIDAFAIIDNVDGGGSSLPGDRTSPPSNGSNGFATWPTLPSNPTLRTSTQTLDTAGRTTAATTY